MNDIFEISMNQLKAAKFEPKWVVVSLRVYHKMVKGKGVIKHMLGKK